MVAKFELTDDSVVVVIGTGAGGGVRHLVEIGFFEQHQLRVARDAAREFVGKADSLREGQHGNAIRAADGGRRGLWTAAALVSFVLGLATAGTALAALTTVHEALHEFTTELTATLHESAEALQHLAAGRATALAALNGSCRGAR